MKITFDHNCVIHLESGGPTADRIRALLANPEHQCFVVNVGASEMQRFGVRPGNYEAFTSRGVTHAGSGVSRFTNTKIGNLMLPSNQVLSLFTTIDASLHASMREQAEAVRRKFKAAVRAIVASEGGEKPAIIGTGTLFRVDGARYLVTAAHVVDCIDDMPRGALHVLGSAGTEPVQILGSLTATAVPNTGRGADKIDIAFWKLGEKEAKTLGDVRFIEGSEIYMNRAPTKDRFFMAMGFPYSRNKKRVDYRRRQISTAGWTYTSGVVDMPALAQDLGVSGERHLFMPYDKYSQNEDGLKVSSVEPRGMSGGPILHLGNFGDPSMLNPRSRGPGKVAGILIEKSIKHKALVAVKIGVVLSAIRRHSAP
jgi:hypothetical protein